MSRPSPTGKGHFITIGYLVALTVLVVSAILSYNNGKEVLDQGTRVVHTQRVIANLEKAYASAAEAESHQRGYVITGDQQLLEKFRKSLQIARGGLDQAIGLTQDNPAQQTRLASLKETLTAKVEEMEAVVQLRQSEGFNQAVQRVVKGEGIRLMVRIRALVDEAESAESALLAARERETRSSIRQAVIFYLVGTVAGILMLTALYILISRFVRILIKARELETAHREELSARIEEKERAEERVQVALHELERSNGELQDFAFVASHDLQEPLRKIQAFGDRIKMRSGDALDAESMDYLARMQSAASRMQGLINDILNLSRVATKARAFVPVDLNEAFEGALDDLRRRIEETNAKVEIGELPTISADAVQMQQLAMNLIGNALKFHRADVPPVIKVDAAQVKVKGQKMVKLSFTDNGIGFDQRHAEKIFTVFQRLHGRSEYEGSGVGLSICRKIVERHGGTIAAQSTLGEGAVFEVTLLIAAKEAL